MASSVPQAKQRSVATLGHYVFGQGALAGKTQQVVRPASLGARARQTSATERVHANHSTDDVAIDVNVADGGFPTYLLGKTLAAAMNTELGDLKETLREGDCTHFNSRTPHTASNLTSKDVVLLYVGTPSVFKPDRQPD